MDIEKLIHCLQCCARVDAHNIGCDDCGLEYCGPECQQLCGTAATALSTLQAENEKLRAELERCKEKNAGLALALLTECAPNPDCLGDDEWRAIRAELEQIKLEKAVALEHLHGICSACKNYSPYHNRGKCRYCAYEPARDKDAEANDNWEWSGQKKEG